VSAAANPGVAMWVAWAVHAFSRRRRSCLAIPDTVLLRRSGQQAQSRADGHLGLPGPAINTTTPATVAFALLVDRSAGTASISMTLAALGTPLTRWSS